MFKELFVEAKGKAESDFEKDFGVLFKNLGYNEIIRDDGIENLLVFKHDEETPIYITDTENDRSITFALREKDWIKKIDFLVKKYKGKLSKEDRNTYIFPINGKFTRK